MRKTNLTTINSFLSMTKNKSYLKLNKSKIKKTIFKKPNSNRFDFLYENSKIIRKKLELEKLITEFKEKKKRNPEISNKAKLIIRNQNLFHERLYNNIIKTIEHEEFIEEKNLFFKNNKEKNLKYQKFYRDKKEKKNNSFSFNPLLNKKSIFIAENLPIKSKERLESLNKKLEKRKKEIIEEKQKKNDSEYFSINKSSFSNLKKEKKINKRCNNLYLNALKLNKKKENLSREKEKIKENFYKNFSFEPELNKNYSSRIVIHSNNTFDIYTRNNIWKDNIINKINKLKAFNLGKEKLNNTFTPRINYNIMNIDSSFIKNNINEYLLYINQFNEREKKKNYEKKKIHNYKNFYHKNTKKIFIDYEDENTLKNYLMNKYHINKSRNNSISEIKKQRSILGTNHFFYTSHYFYQNHSQSLKSKNYTLTFTDAVKKILRKVS